MSISITNHSMQVLVFCPLLQPIILQETGELNHSITGEPLKFQFRYKTRSPISLEMSAVLGQSHLHSNGLYTTEGSS